MKTALFCFLIAVLAGSLALSQTAAPATPTKKKTTPVKKKTAATSSAKSSSAKKKTSVRKKAVAGPPRQLAPTPDRYREIQQALADKGYLKSAPNGLWDDQSAEALKQFQTDRHLSPTGKISALSLIDLGLGPKQPDAPAGIPGPPPPQGSRPAAPDPADLPPPPETLPPPAN